MTRHMSNYGKTTLIPNVFCNVESPSRPLRKRESTQFFPAEIVCPITEQVLGCDVEYSVRDVGTMMKANEKMLPVILAVKTHDGTDLLNALDGDTIAMLEVQAGDFWRDACAGK